MTAFISESIDGINRTRMIYDQSDLDEMNRERKIYDNDNVQKEVANDGGETDHPKQPKKYWYPRS